MKKRRNTVEQEEEINFIQPRDIGISKAQIEGRLINLINSFEDEVGKRISRIEIYRNNSNDAIDVKIRIET